MPVQRDRMKFATGRSIAYYGPNENTDTCIQMVIKKNLADGWLLKGEMIRAHPTSEIWVQRLSKPASANTNTGTNTVTNTVNTRIHTVRFA